MRDLQVEVVSDRDGADLRLGRYVGGDMGKRLVLTAVGKLKVAVIEGNEAGANVDVRADIRAAELVQNDVEAHEGLVSDLQALDDHQSPLAPVGRIALGKARAALGEVQLDVGILLLDELGLLNGANVIMEGNAAADIAKPVASVKRPEHAVGIVKVVVVEPKLDVKAVCLQLLVHDPKELRLGLGMPDAGRHIGFLLAVELVLCRQGADLDPVRGVCADELQDVLGIALKILISHIAAAHASARLHPEGGAPGGGEEIDVGIDPNDLLQHRNDVLLVARDREMLERNVAVNVVVGIHLGGIVAGADAKTADRKSEPFLRVKMAQKLLTLGGLHQGKLVAGGGGDSKAEAVKAAVALGGNLEEVGALPRHRGENALGRSLVTVTGIDQLCLHNELLCFLSI